MSGPSYARPDRTPSAPPVAWSEEEASGDDMATSYVPRDDMTTGYLAHDDVATTYLSAQDEPFDGEWSGDPARDQFGAFDDQPAQPWYRNPVVLIAAAALAFVAAAVVFVMKTSRHDGFSDVPVTTSVQSTSSSPSPSASTSPPPPSASTTPSSPSPSNSVNTPSRAGGANTPYGPSAGGGGGGGLGTQPAKPSYSAPPGTGGGGASPSTGAALPTSGATPTSASTSTISTVPWKPGLILKCLLQPKNC